jgi:hypothetical protein
LGDATRCQSLKHRVLGLEAQRPADAADHVGVDQIVDEAVRLLGALRATGCDIFIDREDDCNAGWSRLKRGWYLRAVEQTLRDNPET